MKDEKKTVSNTAEMMTISRTEYESQQAQLTELKLQNQWLLEQLGLAKKRQFGSSSEKLQEELMDQLSLDFNEAEAYAHGTRSATAEQVAETVLHGDETTLQVLKEPGRPSVSKSYMWLYRTSGCAESPIVLYEYQRQLMRKSS